MKATAVDRIAELERKLREKNLDNCVNLVAAIEEFGEVWAVDTVVIKGYGQPLMTTTEMHEAVTKLREIGINVCRVDAGGRPTWRVSA